MPKRKRTTAGPARFVVGRVTAERRGRKGIYVARFADPRTTRRSLRTADYDTAFAAASELNSRLATGSGAGPGRVARRRLRDVVAEWLDAKRADGVAPKTLSRYANEVSAFADFMETSGAAHLEQADAALYDRYRAVRARTRSPKSLETEVTLVKGFIRWCVDRDYLPRDPLRSCKIPRAPQVVHLTPRAADVERLLAAAAAEGPLLHAVLSVKAFAGLRVGEVAALRPADVDLDAGWLHVTNRRNEFRSKSGLDRKVPVHPRLLATLRAYRAAGLVGGERFFPGPSYARRPGGMPHLNPRWVNARVKALAGPLGIAAGRECQGLVAHGLRKSFRTQAALARVPDAFVDRWFGHSPANAVRDIYIGDFDEESQRLMRSIPFAVPSPRPPDGVVSDDDEFVPPT